ncbi:MAG: beta-lactamase family protein [Alphaproteobacteria bacterium]|nr:beta-lactamase family protein [Alphaproteobacteria bacterium]MBL7096938.1 beta-lactamase family protein [Alphaproteobacteria bacterium]
MGRILRILLVVVVLIAVWAVAVGLGTREGWWRPLPAPRGDAAAFLKAAEARYASESRGNVAMAILVNGRVAVTYFSSHGRPVDGQSLFQVASMSKWFTAWGIMTLVEKGRLDLDAPVSRYLHRWQLPPSRFDNNAVTVRRLLSHTAGLTDGLGFRGFPPGHQPPTIEAELTHPADPMANATGFIRVERAPGASWQYSGGGYLLLQLLIEEVSGQSFNDYMRSAVLRPLGMTESTFVDPDPAHLADFYDQDGTKAIHYKFTALAAASLYTSVDDLTRFLQSQLPGPNGQPAGRGVLKPATLEQMRQVTARVFGIPIWGLGEILYAPTNTGGFVIGHDGNNYPAINTTARLDPATGDGIIVLETGNGTTASRIGSDWTYWHTGVVDLPTIVFEAQTTLIVLATGAVVILLGAVIVMWRGRRRA